MGNNNVIFLIVESIYVLELYGYKWSDDIAPRIRLVFAEYRGYIEARPVKSLFNQQHV